MPKSKLLLRSLGRSHFGDARAGHHLQARRVRKPAERPRRFYSVEPQVAARRKQVASGPEAAESVPRYELDGWLGDALIRGSDCFLMTEPGCRLLEFPSLTGVRFEPVDVTQAAAFLALYSSGDLPPFRRLVVIGTPGHDDIGAGDDDRLVVSSEGLQLLQLAGIRCARIEVLPRAD